MGTCCSRTAAGSAQTGILCLRAAGAFWEAGRVDGGSSLAAAATAARCGDCIVARRRCDESFGAGARTDDRSPRYSSAECAQRFCVFAATGAALVTAFSRREASFVNAAAYYKFSEQAEPVERSASLRKSRAKATALLD